jgi:putative transposase
VVWSFAYPALRSLFGVVLLLGRSEHSKELEILVLRHELAISRRGSQRPRIEPADRALLAALSRALPRSAWAAFSVRPETLLRWHRRLVARRWIYPHSRPGRPPLQRERRELILRLARENPHWGYQRIAGELKSLGLAASPTTIRKVLACEGVPPAPERARQSWCSFLRQRAASVLACDFFPVETLGLQRIYVLFVLSLATRRVEFIACTPNPDGAWVAQQARNLVMQFGERELPFRLLIHDRDRKFSRSFDEVFRSEGIEVIRTPVQAPNANAQRRALGAHDPQRLPGSHPHPRTPTSRTCPARVHKALQPAPAAPCAQARSSRRQQPRRQRPHPHSSRRPTSRPARRIRTSSVTGFAHPTRS